MAEDQLTFNFPESLPYQCKYCGKGYSRKKKFCSQQCGSQYRYKNQYKILRKKGQRGCHKKICVQCKIGFLGTKKDKFCSRKCVHLGWTKKRELTCKQCGIVFMPKAADRKGFCSRKCFFTYITERRENKEAVQSQIEPYILAYCRCCGKDFPMRTGLEGAQKYCSGKCAFLWLNYQRRFNSEKINRKCKICRRPFMTKIHFKRTCSDGCSNENIKQGRLDNKRRRRAKESACTVVVFSRWEIFKRDDWTCYLCGRRVSRKYRCPHPLTPTIDHVIPIAKGGDDAPWNVKCCCFKCNSEKGDAVLNMVS